MLEILGLPAKELPDQPWMLYNVLTTHGSKLQMYFRRTHNLYSKTDLINPVFGFGELYVRGRSISQGAQVSIAGLGSDPQVDGDVLVNVQQTDNGPVRSYELIAKVLDIQEVTQTPDYE